MRYIAVILLLLTMNSCWQHKPNDGAAISASVTDSAIKKIPLTDEENDSMHLRHAIQKLEGIQYFIKGSDSIITGKDGSALIELTTAKSTVFVEMVVKAGEKEPEPAGVKGEKIISPLYYWKYMVTRVDGKSGHRPEAAIIELSFADHTKAADWFENNFDIKADSVYKSFKPKTLVWNMGSKVYLVQTYATPDFDHVYLLKETLIKDLKEE